MVIIKLHSWAKTNRLQNVDCGLSLTNDSIIHQNACIITGNYAADDGIGG